MDEHEKLIKLAESLVNRDESKNCPFCSKSEWGEDLHREDCPFRMAYDILDKEGATAYKKRKK